MEFKLDTSGEVDGRGWSDLSTFTQGYIEALFAAFDPEPTPGVRLAPGPFAFSDLAPETLARIIADCEDAKASLMCNGGDGAWFWKHRQVGYFEPFPPLTVQLGDDGKVRFA